MEELVTLNKKEQKRLMVLNQVEMGKIIGREASEILGPSLRHVRRLSAAYRKEGARALADGNRGRRPKHALDEGPRKQVIELAQSTYPGCNTQRFTELLVEREGIDMSAIHGAPYPAPGWHKESQEEASTKTPQPQRTLSQRGDAAAN